VRPVPNKRDAQKQETRERILAALVASLVEVGYAQTTTVEVQRRAGISRGALLHHFPSRAALFEAAVRYLVEQNERAARDAPMSAEPGVHPVTRAIRALAYGMSRPAYAAELELWAAARTDAELRAVLRPAERSARRDLSRVIADVFGEPWISAPTFRVVSEVTIELLRGLATSRALRADRAREATIVAQWSELAARLLAPPR
jgi:AcrR family transcriptional regulator